MGDSLPPLTLSFLHVVSRLLEAFVTFTTNSTVILIPPKPSTSNHWNLVIELNLWKVLRLDPTCPQIDLTNARPIVARGL
ncbi:hypothetical protein BC826DRAFT_1051926 [Russula brevipes]|nr:hypothetical protein BC826DRAFT_1051926 [Russula brevipes]